MKIKVDFDISTRLYKQIVEQHSIQSLDDYIKNGIVGKISHDIKNMIRYKKVKSEYGVITYTAEIQVQNVK